MIKTFKDKETQKIYHQQFSRKPPSSIQRIALRKLKKDKLEDKFINMFIGLLEFIEAK